MLYLPTQEEAARLAQLASLLTRVAAQITRDAAKRGHLSYDLESLGLTALLVAGEASELVPGPPPTPGPVSDVDESLMDSITRALEIAGDLTPEIPGLSPLVIGLSDLTREARSCGY